MKVINNNNGTFTLVKEITLTEEHIDNLSNSIIEGSAEFRDFDRKEYSRDGKFKLSICMELYELGLLEDKEDSWHFTLIPTELGKQIILSIK